VSADLSTQIAKGLINREETKRPIFRTDCPQPIMICEKCGSKGAIYQARYVQVNGSDTRTTIGEKVDCCDSDSLLELWCDNCDDHTEQTYVYARKCEVCKTGFNSGYMTGEIKYYCSHECELKECKENDYCKCHWINMRPEFIDQELLKKETKVFRSWFKKLAERDPDKDSDVAVNTFEWIAFIDSNTGSNYFEKYFVEHWEYTEWEVEEMVDDFVFDEYGNSYLLAE